MKETLNYIRLLNWGYGGFAPMTLGQDFEKSLQQVQERLALLDGLDYGALLVEATSPNGKANLLKYQSTEDCIEYSLHFMRDRKELLRDHIPTMFIGFKKAVDRYRADGLWTDEQWREYRGAISELERAFELRLKEFATAYDYSLSDDPNNPEPQQGENKQQKDQQQKPQNGEVVLPDVLNTQKTQVIFDEAIIRGWMQPNGMGGYKWLGLKDWKRGKQQQFVYMIGQMYGYKKGDSGNDGNNIPCKALEKLFGIGGIYSLLIKCWQVNKPQPWRQAIDEMIATALQKITASTSN